MTAKRNIPPGYEQIAAISSGAASAFSRSIEENPDTNQYTLRQLTNVNSQLALHIARTAQQLAEADVSPANAYVAGALFLVGSLATQAEGEALDSQFLANPLESAFIIETTPPQTSWET